MGHITGDLIAHALGRDGRDLLADTLVVLEVEAELTVEALDDKPGSPLGGLRPDTTHLRKAGSAGCSQFFNASVRIPYRMFTIYPDLHLRQSHTAERAGTCVIARDFALLCPIWASRKLLAPTASELPD